MIQTEKQDPDHRRSQDRLEQAKNHLDQKWQTLTMVIRETTLITEQ